jgi:hypothetical protein
MNNRKRANGIAGGIISIIVGLVLIIVAFPVHSILTILCLGAMFGLYKLFNLMRNTIEDHLDEKEINNKWIKEKNIK